MKSEHLFLRYIPKKCLIYSKIIKNHQKIVEILKSRFRFDSSIENMFSEPEPEIRAFLMILNTCLLQNESIKFSWNPCFSLKIIEEMVRNKGYPWIFMEDAHLRQVVAPSSGGLCELPDMFLIRTRGDLANGGGLIG